MQPIDVIPFSAEALDALFAEYNRAIWPWALIAYALGAAAVLLVLRPVASNGRIVSSILAALWLWTGIVFHLLFFDSINLSAPLFALLFVVQGLLLLWTGVFKGRIAFGLVRNSFGAIGVALASVALVVQPLLSLAAGATQHFGVTPASLVVFTFGLLLLVQGRTPVYLTIVPLLWALVGGALAVLLEISQDYALLAAGLAGMILVLLKNRALSR
jgi:hypothetical protein